MNTKAIIITENKIQSIGIQYKEVYFKKNKNNNFSFEIDAKTAVDFFYNN